MELLKSVADVKNPSKYFEMVLEETIWFWAENYRQNAISANLFQSYLRLQMWSSFNKLK